MVECLQTDFDGLIMEDEKLFQVGDKIKVLSVGNNNVPIDDPFHLKNHNGKFVECRIVAVNDKTSPPRYAVETSDKSLGWSFSKKRDKYTSTDSGYKGYAWDICSEAIIGLTEEPKKEKKMPKNDSKLEDKSLLETVKEDAADASYRIAAKQISRGARSALVNLMKSKGFKRNHIKAVQEMLDTEGGLAAVSAALGLALNYIPGLKDDPRAKTLAKEFRVEGMAMGGNLMIAEVMQHFGPVFASIMDLPMTGTEAKLRVPAVATDALKAIVAQAPKADEEEDDEEEEETKTPAKRAKA